MSARDVDDLLLHLRGLVLVRGILEHRGVSAAEIEEYDTEIERLRERLAQVVVSDAGR